MTKNFGAKILIWKINVARFARNKWDFLSNFQTLWCMHFLISILKYSNHFSYRTFSMAHSDVAFNVKRRCSSESECLHMSINQCVVHVVCHAPCALESRNQFVVDRASMMVDQLDLFVGSIMGIAVVDQNVESIWTNKKQKIKNVVLSAIQVQISATNTYFSEGEWFFNYIRRTAQKVSRRFERFEA